ncbi:hypothetical protein MTR67_038288 [Solanum verrucosum]|uniref:Bet v I/Major latex protein domain-containing protein n=1 Tax=Solanum verrucosum TaxID=315347 RepID=A0AAF0UF10_SOLVR|nr:hypothetical protein MTR67_038288 [Solanum verrucosum]
MIQVFDFTIYVWLDPGASLSFVTPYVAMNFDVIPEQLSEPFSVSTPVGESILAERVYRDCPISVNHKSTMADLAELDMVDFDVILGMDWLHVCYALVDCRTRVVKFQFPNEPVSEWKSSSAVPKEGDEKVVKVIIDEINKEKRLVTFKAFEGHLIEEYKAFKATIHIENEGDNSLVIWTIEYEKQNEDIPEPFSYLQLATNLTKDVDTHHVNQ